MCYNVIRAATGRNRHRHTTPLSHHPSTEKPAIIMSVFYFWLSVLFVDVWLFQGRLLLADRSRRILLCHSLYLLNHLSAVSFSVCLINSHSMAFVYLDDSVYDNDDQIRPLHYSQLSARTWFIQHKLKRIAGILFSFILYANINI